MALQAAAAPAAAKAKPSQPPLSADRSRTLIKNVEAITAHRPLNPVEQADLDQAKKVVAQDTVKGLEQKAQDNGRQLDAADTQALADARAQAGDADTAAKQSPPTARRQENQPPRTVPMRPQIRTLQRHLLAGAAAGPRGQRRHAYQMLAHQEQPLRPGPPARR